MTYAFCLAWMEDLDIPALFLVHQDLRYKDSFPLDIKPISEKQFSFYNVIHYKTWAIISRGHLAMTHRRTELEFETVIIHGARACQANKPDCFTTQRAGRSGWQPHSQGGGKVRRGGSLLRAGVAFLNRKGARSCAHQGSMSAHDLSGFAPRLITESKLSDRNPVACCRSSNLKQSGWIRHSPPIPLPRPQRVWRKGKKCALQLINLARLLHGFCENWVRNLYSLQSSMFF